MNVLSAKCGSTIYACMCDSRISFSRIFFNIFFFLFDDLMPMMNVDE